MQCKGCVKEREQGLLIEARAEAAEAERDELRAEMAAVIDFADTISELIRADAWDEGCDAAYDWGRTEWNRPANPYRAAGNTE